MILHVFIHTYHSKTRHDVQCLLSRAPLQERICVCVYVCFHKNFQEMRSKIHLISSECKWPPSVFRWFVIQLLRQYNHIGQKK